MDDEAPRVEAVAVANGKIVAVGSNAEIASWRTLDTRVISARGGSVLPGFVEAHMHLFGGGSQLSHLDLAGVLGFGRVSEAC